MDETPEGKSPKGVLHFTNPREMHRSGTAGDSICEGPFGVDAFVGVDCAKALRVRLCCAARKVLAVLADVDWAY